MEERSGIRAHACRLENRNAASLTGVREVVSFDENQVVMDTDMGLLTIKGKDLHVSRLTVEKGEMEVEGQIDSLTYSSNEAYRKAGQSKAFRVLETEGEAQALAADIGGTVEYRPSKARRCGYCTARFVCSQYAVMKEAGLVDGD